MKNLCFIITGASGYIARFLIEELSNEKHKILAFSENPDFTKTRFSNNVIKFTGKFDSNKNKLIRLVKELNNDHTFFFIHLYGISSVKFSQSNPMATIYENLISLLNVFKFCTNLKIKYFMFPSTSLVYSNNLNYPLNENSETDPKTFYAQTKLYSEAVIENLSKKHDIKSIILRLSNVYGGIIKDGTIFSDIIKQLKTNNKFITMKDENAVSDYIHIYDVVNAMKILIMNGFKSHFEIYNISSNKGLSANFIAKKIIKLTSSKKIIQSLNKEIKENNNTILDNQKLKNLGWLPSVDIEWALEKVL